MGEKKRLYRFSSTRRRKKHWVNKIAPELRNERRDSKKRRFEAEGAKLIRGFRRPKESKGGLK